LALEFLTFSFYLELSQYIKDVPKITMPTIGRQCMYFQLLQLYWNDM